MIPEIVLCIRLCESDLDGVRFFREDLEEVLIGLVVPDSKNEVEVLLGEQKLRRGALVDTDVAHLDRLPRLQHLNLRVLGEVGKLVSQLLRATRSELRIGRSEVPHERELLLLGKRAGEPILVTLKDRENFLFPVALNLHGRNPLLALLPDPCSVLSDYSYVERAEPFLEEGLVAAADYHKVVPRIL